MDKREEIKDTTKLVFHILSECEEARNSDNVLFEKVYRQIAADKGININSISVPMFFNGMKFYGFPAIETVSRVRRRLQSKNPELRGNRSVSSERKENEKIFFEFSLK